MLGVTEFLLKVFGETILGELLKFAQGVLTGIQNNMAQRELGAAEAVNQINADTAQHQKDMADAETNAPGSRGDLVDRLRREADQAGAGATAGN